MSSETPLPLSELERLIGCGVYGYWWYHTASSDIRALNYCCPPLSRDQIDRYLGQGPRAYYATRLANGNRDLEPGWYVFVQTWDEKDPGKREMAPEILKLQKTLGYDHIALVIGVVKELKLGVAHIGNKRWKRVYTKSFEGKMYDMTTDAETANGPAWVNVEPFVPSDKINVALSYCKPITEEQADVLEAKGESWIKRHPVYHVSRNNCKTDIDELLSAL